MCSLNKSKYFFENCGKSICSFFNKCFNINPRVIKYHINTGNPINSNDLNTYLFADECDSCKNKSSKELMINKKAKNNGIREKYPSNLGSYIPPIKLVGSCDSFESISSDEESESESKLCSNKQKIKIVEEHYIL